MAKSSARTFKTAAYAHLAEVGKALSNPTRLEILELLAQAPRTVERLADEVDQSVANTSHHLQALKRAKLVKGTRNGLYIEYEIAGIDVALLVVRLQAVASTHLDGLERLTREFFESRDGLEAIDGATLLERLREESVVLVDVRPEHEFTRGHLPGALGIPLAELESRIDELPRDRTIVAYCRGPFCTFSADAVRRLRELGFDARRTEASVQSLSHAGSAP